MSHRVSIEADVPDHLVQALLEHIWEFDAQQPGCHFVIVANVPEQCSHEIEAMLDQLSSN